MLMLNLPERPARAFDLEITGDVLSLEDLWLRCFALGGANTLEQLAAFLYGELLPTTHEYNLIAVALNEWLIDRGIDRIIPYIEDDSTIYQIASWSRSAAIPSVPDSSERSAGLLLRCQRSEAESHRISARGVVRLAYRGTLGDGERQLLGDGA
jgi:hypothetical protein